MKCAICGKNTTWDASYGLEEFLVCNSCHDALAENNPKNYHSTLLFIFKCGRIRREKEKENELKA